MSLRVLFISVFSLIVMSACQHQTRLQYPVTEKVDSSDNYFGTVIADPYRWLENDTSAMTARWVEEQNAITNSYLETIPFRQKIHEDLTEKWDYPKTGVPFREGPWYFFFRNNGLQNQFVLYVREGIEGEPRVLLDPNTFSVDGTVALSETSVSHDGRYLAYSIARSGSDWNEICLLEIATGTILPDTLKWVKFSSMAWEGNGFFYSRYDEPAKGSELSQTNRNQKVFYHRVGTTQQDDRLVWQDPEHPERFYGTQVTDDQRFLLLYISESTYGNALSFKDLKSGGEHFIPLVRNFESEYTVIDNLGGKLLVMTNFNAPRRKLVMMDPQRPDPMQWKTIIPEREDVLESVTVAGNRLICTYQHNAASRAMVYTTGGEFLHEVNLPGIGTLSGFSGKRADTVAFYGFTSFTFPTTVYRYNIASNRSQIYTRPEIPGFNPDDYEVKQVFYPGKDRTMIPMFIVSRKGITADGNNPVLLYGYGGFNVSLNPGFSISRLIFLEHGGIFAMANLRGGGEFGEEWYKAGTLDRKQNVFDDFIAGAEYLISMKYTSPSRLAIMGGSNGGLLVGACMTQRPELFAVAIPQVGVLDMLRYHKFTIGHAWATDYGTSDTPEGFGWLIRYSPLHNLRDNTAYPATLAFTADHDDRVVPAHTFKFIATLQEKQAGDKPVLVRIETKAGHGAGKPTSKTIDEATDLWSFVLWNLGMKVE